MGILSLPFALMLLAAAAPGEGTGLQRELPMKEKAFRSVLLERDVSILEQACLDPMIATSSRRKQALRNRLLVLNPVPETLESVLIQANALLSCGSPDTAAKVLNRYSPAAGQERRLWMLMRWQAAAAALDHRQAALALRRLVDGDLIALGLITLIEERNALDQLAEHEAAQGRMLVAAELILQAPLEGVPGARRLSRAAEWLAVSDIDEADRLLETALDQAAASEAWGLAMELLQLQLQLQLAAGWDGERARQRMVRLAARLDDRFSLRQLQPEAEIDGDLRSPREPGGHAAVGDPTTAPLLP